MLLRSILLGLSSYVLLSPTIASAQAPQSSNASAPPQELPAIRSTTRLVQVSVVVQDKKGKPVTGLKKEDFKIFDEGKPQDIAFFSAATAAPLVPGPSLLPPNVFTNRFDLKGQGPGAVTVVLFDALNTAPQDQAYVRKEILRFLQALKPQDHVAVYALTSQILILHEFTQDASVLVEAVNRFTPKELAAYDASHPAFFDVPALNNDAMWMRFQERVNQANAEIADQNKINRVAATSAAIEAIADHVAAIPGRKNLVWVTGGFPLQVISGVIAPDRPTALLGPEENKALQALNRVDMAIYPVDASGVVTTSSMDPKEGFHGASINCADCNNEGATPGTKLL